MIFISILIFAILNTISTQSLDLSLTYSSNSYASNAMATEHSFIHSRKIFHKESLPDISTDTNLEVFHLRSFPQLLIDSEVGRFAVQTSALALRNIETQRVLVFEYSPYNYSASYLPRIYSNDNKIYLAWDKRAVITYREALDINFWQTSTFLALINNVVYENYIQWIEKYIQKRRIFIPQAICSTADESSCFTYSQTWDTFLRDSFNVMSQLAVQMRAIIPPRGSDMQLISHIEPEMFSESSLYFVNHTKHHPHHQKRKPGKYYGSTISVRRHQRHLRSSQHSRRLLDEDTEDYEYNSPGDSSSPSDSLPPDINSNLSTVWSTGNTSYVNGSFQSFGNDTDDYFLDIANGLLDGNNSIPLITNISSLTPLDIVDYYTNLLNCMQEYQLEDYTSAYKSCLREEPTFIHIESDQYYRVLPRYPYLHVNEYLQSIPNARLVQRSSSDLFDYIICACLVIFTCMGLIVGFYRLDLGNWLWYKTASIRKRRVSKAPPVEGGYSSFSSELPVYRIWGDSKQNNGFTSSNDRASTNSPNQPEAVLSNISDNGSSNDFVRLPEATSREHRLFHPKEGIYVPRIFGGFGGGAGMDDTALRKLAEEEGPRSTRSSRSRYKDHIIYNGHDQYVSIVNYLDNISENSATLDDLDIILQDIPTIHLPSSDTSDQTA